MSWIQILWLIAGFCSGFYGSNIIIVAACNHRNIFIQSIFGFIGILTAYSLMFGVR